MKTLSRAPFAGSVALAFLAGFLDAVGFVISGGLFVSFMSGNSTQGAVGLTAGEGVQALVALTLVVGFVVGVVLGRVVDQTAGRRSLGARVIGLAVALCASTALVVAWPEPGFSLAAVSVVMGAMNTLFVVETRARVAITYATGTLVSVGLGIADRITGKGGGAVARPLAMWTSITVGAVVGALAWRAWGMASLLVAVAGLLAVGLALLWAGFRGASGEIPGEVSTGNED